MLCRLLSQGLKSVLLNELDAIEAARSAALSKLAELALDSHKPSAEFVRQAGDCSRCRWGAITVFHNPCPMPSPTVLGVPFKLSGWLIVQN